MNVQTFQPQATQATQAQQDYDAVKAQQNQQDETQLNGAPVSAFWAPRKMPQEGPHVYSCSNCSKLMTARIAHSGKNMGKAFLSCFDTSGGCGLWSLLSELPGKEYRDGKNFRRQAKRAYVDQAPAPVQQQELDVKKARIEPDVYLDQHLTALWDEIKQLKQLAQGQSIQMAGLTIENQELKTKVEQIDKIIAAGWVNIENE